MPQYGTWFSYTGSAKLILAIVLLAAAAAIVVAGAKLQLPARLPRPSGDATTLMVVAWALSIIAFVACVPVHAEAEAEDPHAGQAQAPA